MTRRTVPTVAGRYRLEDRIGTGGMGSVWRARDLRRGAEVAVKVLGTHESSLLLRFVREQSVRIRHPHLAAPAGWAADDETVLLTMDLVRGGSLQQLVEDHGPLPESYVAVLLDQALQGLQAVHAAGIVHRDVKPANLLLEPTGSARPHVRLADFGVAALVGDPDGARLTVASGLVGTPGYLAPEQAAGAAPDPRQDLHALGVTAVQLLTGLGPRRQRGIPPGRLAPLLAALTAPDPVRRPASARAALDLLRHLGVPGGAPWQAQQRPPYVPDRFGTGIDRATALAWAAVACFTASTVLSLVALWLLLA